MEYSLIVNNMIFFTPLCQDWRVGSGGLPCFQHKAGSDTIFIQIYMDVPPGVPGVSKNHIYFFTNETVFLLR